MRRRVRCRARPGADTYSSNSSTKEGQDFKRAGGRWRQSAPKPWRVPTIRVERTYEYDEVLDVHTFHPSYEYVVDDGSTLNKSTLVVKSVGGLMTIPMHSPLEESENIVEVYNLKTGGESGSAWTAGDVRED